MASIGERIGELRKAAGLSQGELASIMGITRQAISKWENDLSSPDTIKLIQLSDVLNTDVEYLATGRKKEIIETNAEISFQRADYQPKEIVKAIVVEKPIIKTRRIVRIKYRTDPRIIFGVGLSLFILGLLIGYLI